MSQSSSSEPPKHSSRPRIPFLRPRPPRLSALREALERLDDSERFTNFGPIERDFCNRMRATYFRGGSVATVCNATLGLMLAVRQALLSAGWSEPERRARRFALMPAFSFAAIPQATMWNGLTPWFVDIDAETWLPCPQSELDVLNRHHREIAVILPAATFGNSLDLPHYADLSSRFGIPVVVDAAASIGCLDQRGEPFGAGSRSPVIYSLHATKVFSTAEAGLVYCADEQVVEDIRRMSNFGFGDRREAIMPGLNAKLSEVGALLCSNKLDEIETVAAHRVSLAEEYRRLLPECTHQKWTGRRLAYQFYPVLLPEGSNDRSAVLERLVTNHQVEAAHYFSPHLAEQALFAPTCSRADLTTTEDISSRIVSLPIHDTFTASDVTYVAHALSECLRSTAGRAAVRTASSSTPRAQLVNPPPEVDVAALAEERRRLEVGRGAAAYHACFSKRRPLVSVCVATSNRAQLLVERCLPSLLRQTYPHIEIIVIGDCCTDDTAERVRRIGDRRIYFENLAVRGPYPPPGWSRWRVAGTYALNRGLALASGDFITHLDDDDQALEERIEVLVEEAQFSGAELVYHPFFWQGSDGLWHRGGNGEYDLGQMTTGSVFYHAHFARYGWDANAYQVGEPGDWNRFRRLRALGITHRFVDRPLLFHFRERNHPPFQPLPGETFLPELEPAPEQPT
jgi:dTDP-4-amino-4,6-dideoxygalactose transaminase